MPRYLYNGIELPQLPEWDKTAYPYAFMYKIIGTHYGFVVSDTTTYYKEGSVYVGNTMACAVTPDSFVSPTADNELTGFEKYGSVFWSNHDILNSDGTLYLAASEPVPIVQHVTESKGDGYALYNGVKLPNIDIVWTDKETYPYAFIANLDMTEYIENLVCYFLAQTTTTIVAINGYPSYGESGQVIFFVFCPTQENADAFAESYGVTPEVGKWSFVENRNYNPEENIGVGVELWTNHDILNTDNSVYLAASDPIPLDGMNVIEWDGVTEGLENLMSTYKVSNTVLTVDQLSNAVGAYCEYGVMHQGYVSELGGITDYDQMGFVTAGVCNYAYNTTTFPSTGLWFLCGSDNNGSFYTTLFAYTPATAEPEEPEEPEEPAEPTERSLYSYNGTTFPNINTVWTDKTTYPYAVLIDNGHLSLLTKRPYYDSVNGRYKWPAETYTRSVFTKVGNGWSFLTTTIDSQLINMGMVTPLWLNVDWLTETGEVYQATTEPVYVGEADPVPEAESYYLYSHHFLTNVKCEIPALPYWDKEKYPYYLIATSNVFKKSYFEEFYEFVLAISTEPFYEKSTYYPATDVTENQILVPSQNTEVKLCWYRYDYPGFVWSPFILKEPVIENGTWKYTVKFFTSDVILSNVNILDSNGYICAGLNQLLPVPTKLENFICGYIAGLSGGHTEFRDNTWPIQFDVNVVLRNKVQLAVKTPKISDIVMSESEIANLKVSVIKQDGMVYELVRDEDSEVVTFDYGYRSTYHSVDKSESVYVFSFHTSGDGDTVLSGPVPETGTYCMCSRDNSIIRIDK